MSLLETKERLCEVVRLQDNIIEKQTEDKRELIEKDFY